MTDEFRPNSRVTLREVAQAAEVSVSTASRVLSPSARGRQDSPTARRVQTAARELGYEPNQFAASLRTQRTRMIGVVVPHLTDIVLATIYEGVDGQASQWGYQTVVANSLDDPARQRERALQFINRGVDGLVLGDAHLDNPFLRELEDNGVEFVLVSRRCDTHQAITCDDVAGGRLAGNHLADLGHREILVIAGEAHASTGHDRTIGFRAALEARGIELPEDSVRHCAFDTRGGHEAMLGALDAGMRPSAVFAVNDFTAIGAMGALRDRGLRVGHDVAVVGYNDISIAAELPTPLTSVRSPLREMGARAATALIERLQAESPVETYEQVRLPPSLVVRSSSDSTIDTPLSRRQ